MTDYSFMKYYQPWWDTGCDACGVSQGSCTCKDDWDMKFDDVRDSAPSWWGWLIAPDLTCRFCSRMMSTYDGCCTEGIAYLKYRYAAAFFPQSLPTLFEHVLSSK